MFATPILQRPLEFGADIVGYSATKHIDGQGRSLGGAVLGTQEIRARKPRAVPAPYRPALSPFNAWLLVKGLETLDLRLERQMAGALEVARFLEKQRKVAAHALSRARKPSAIRSRRGAR